MNQLLSFYSMDQTGPLTCLGFLEVNVIGFRNQEMKRSTNLPSPRESKMQAPVSMEGCLGKKTATFVGLYRDNELLRGPHMAQPLPFGM